MSATGPSFWDLLLKTNAELVQMGLKKEDVTAERMAVTGHQRALDKAWARSIGLWGRVATVDRIADRTGKTHAQVRSWAQRWGLRFATKKHFRWQAHLAAGLYYDRADPPELSRRRWGVLPAERVLLISWFQEVLDQHGVTAQEALRWSPTKVVRAWRRVGAVVEPPWDIVGRRRQAQPDPRWPV